MPRDTRVLIVDDSVFMRAVLKDALSRVPGLTVMGTAQNGIEGLDRIRRNRPDVVTLDIEMPGMDGLTVLRHVMRDCPTPIVVVSTKTQTGAELTAEALRIGALECVAKPLNEGGATVENFHKRVVQAVLTAAAANRKRLAAPRAVAPKPSAGVASLDVVVAIGISAGGPQTLHQLLPAVPARFPPIVIAQHMPAGFTAAFAARLNACCQVRVKEAQDADELTPGRILIAPGDRHLRVVRKGAKLAAALSAGPKVSGFRPSVDVLFDSLSTSAPTRTIALVMTGMGSDGAAGIRLLKQKGARTLAQDAGTSIVYGMPKAAAETGCVDRIVALNDMIPAIAELAANPGAVAAT